MHLQLLISTYGERIRNLNKVILDERNNVSYLISFQVGDTNIEIPEYLNREDIKVITTDSIGLSKNRNIGLQNATGDIVMILDDDVKLKPEYLDRVFSFFSNDDIDLAVSKIETPDGQPDYKFYQESGYYLTKINQLKTVSSVEISFRLRSVVENNILFNEAFGLGKEANSGEELIFLNDCRKMGLKMKYFPVFTVGHEYESSAKSISPFSQNRLFVAGAQAGALYGKFAYIRNFLSAFIRLKEILKNRIGFYYFIRIKNAGANYFLSFDSKTSSRHK